MMKKREEMKALLHRQMEWLVEQSETEGGAILPVCRQPSEHHPCDVPSASPLDLCVNDGLEDFTNTGVDSNI